MAVGTIIVSAVTIVKAATQCMNLIKDIDNIRKRIVEIREQRMQQVWKSTNNVDSDVFKQRMQELDDDVKKMLDCLDEYEKVLRDSASAYEKAQQDVKSGADALKSPTKF